jgi:TetR/AcrR family transcriptional repressor of lmrAB and yxaGH operons
MAKESETVARPRSDSRHRIIASARTLLRRQGYHGTGLAQIIEHSGAPRGSVYFLFPGGKEQVAVEAVNEWTAEVSALLEQTRAGSGTAREWVSTMAAHFAVQLRESGFTEGLPVTMITLDSVPGSGALTAACRSAYDTWLATVADGLAGFGIPARDAAGLAKLMLSLLEGAVVLCRVYSSTDPLDDVLRHALVLIPE